MTDFKFYAFFTASKQGVPGLVVTVDVYSGAGVLVENGVAATAIGGGLYAHTYSTANHEDFIAIFKTADLSVDAQHLPALAIKEMAELPDNVWDELIAGHLTAGSTGAKLNSIAGCGVGSITHTYTVTSSVDASPIPDVYVGVSTDAAGANIVAAGYTDAFGVVVFYLDPGPYYFWRSKDRWTFVNPDMEVVS